MSEPLSDDELMARLSEVAAVADPVPEALLSAARAAFGLRELDARVAELIDSKAGLAARALDGSDEEVSSSADVQLEALAALLTDALRG